MDPNQPYENMQPPFQEEMPQQFFPNQEQPIQCNCTCNCQKMAQNDYPQKPAIRRPANRGQFIQPRQAVQHEQPRQAVQHEQPRQFIQPDQSNQFIQHDQPRQFVQYEQPMPVKNIENPNYYQRPIYQMPCRRCGYCPDDESDDEFVDANAIEKYKRKLVKNITNDIGNPYQYPYNPYQYNYYPQYSMPYPDQTDKQLDHKKKVRKTDYMSKKISKPVKYNQKIDATDVENYAPIRKSRRY